MRTTATGQVAPAQLAPPASSSPLFCPRPSSHHVLPRAYLGGCSGDAGAPASRTESTACGAQGRARTGAAASRGRPATRPPPGPPPRTARAACPPRRHPAGRGPPAPRRPRLPPRCPSTLACAMLIWTLAVPSDASRSWAGNCCRHSDLTSKHRRQQWHPHTVKLTPHNYNMGPALRCAARASGGHLDLILRLEFLEHLLNCVCEQLPDEGPRIPAPSCPRRCSHLCQPQASCFAGLFAKRQEERLNFCRCVCVWRLGGRGRTGANLWRRSPRGSPLAPASLVAPASASCRRPGTYSRPSCFAPVSDQQRSRSSRETAGCLRLDQPWRLSLLAGPEHVYAVLELWSTQSMRLFLKDA